MYVISDNESDRQMRLSDNDISIRCEKFIRQISDIKRHIFLLYLYIELKRVFELLI